MHDLANDEVYVQNTGGQRTGPFRGALTGKTLMVFDKTFDVSEGDTILRKLPSGREESYLVHLATFLTGFDNEPVWKIDLEKTTAIPSRTSLKAPTVNIHNSTGIQVGNHNLMNFELAMKEMIKQIDESQASLEEKAEAKSRLQALLTHPLVVSIVGGIAGTLM
ncbi:RIP homotypic interaction motif-containing protein [Achromobacter dolens]|uniref:RIP homotypic interaction motif-containing protein n=1 Tax=Achromobacter dolens TaxID=1287738 RepID=UPI000E320401|nr:RIP homotypic interaction motif-containing protein [Achromobacter dolens]